MTFQGSGFAIRIRLRLRLRLGLRLGLRFEGWGTEPVARGGAMGQRVCFWGDEPLW